MRAALHARQRYRKYGAAVFPTLVNPPTFTFGDSMAQKENYALAIGAATLTRDGTTNPGRITAPIANSGANAQWGTPRVSIVNVTDTSLEVIGRNNFQDAGAGTAGLSIHTAVADTYASRVPASNPTTATTGTSAISNGVIINLERIQHIGVMPHVNALMGGGIDILGNLGHPGALISGTVGGLSAQSAAEFAYMKANCLAQGSTPVVHFRMGINDFKTGTVSPNTAFAAAKTILDGLTGLDGNGGNAAVVIYSCSSVGSTATLGGGFTYQTLNEQVIGKCATSAAPTVLNPDASFYTLFTVSQHTYNYQLYAYALAHPDKFIFVDCTSQSYNFTAQCTYDSAFPDTSNPSSTGDTGDATHYRTVACMKQAAKVVSAISPYISYPLVVPRSSADATTPGGRTRIVNRGPWTTTTITTGFLTGGSASVALPKGGTAGQPTGWACGKGLGSGTIAVSVYDPGDSLGMWVNGECKAVAANDTLVFYPWGASGVTLATLGIGSSIDGAEYQFVFETRWDNATAAGLVAVRATMQTNGSGLYGITTNGETNDDGIGMLDTSPAGNRKIATGWIQASNATFSSLTPIITVVMGSTLGVACNVGVRCVGINKR